MRRQCPKWGPCTHRLLRGGRVLGSLNGAVCCRHADGFESIILSWHPEFSGNRIISLIARVPVSVASAPVRRAPVASAFQNCR